MNKQALEQQLADNPFAPLGEIVYGLLYEDIIFLRLPPETKLNESKIADELGISRTPVKNALTKLAEKGLVQKKDGKVLVVSPMAKEESHQLYEARIAIEGYAAFLAAYRIEPAQLQEMERLVKDYLAIGKQIDVRTYAECDHNFHDIIIQASCNTYIQKMYHEIEGRIRHYRHCLVYQIGCAPLQPILHTASKHHQTIYNALRLGFPDMARSEMERDIGGMLDVFSEWR